MATSQESIQLTPWDNRLVDKISTDAEHVLVELLSDTKAFTVTLPDLRNSFNKEFMFKCIGANTVTVQTVNNQIIDSAGVYSHDLNNGDFVSFRTNNVDKWVKLDANSGVIPAPLIIGDSTNNSTIEADGTLKFNGAATVWQDIYPSSVTVLATGANAASFTSYNGNLRAYEFVGTGVNFKEMNIGFQINHQYKVASAIVPHLHLFVPNDVTGGVIKFYCEYTWTNINQTGAVSTTTINGTITRAAGAGIANNIILSFGSVVGTGMGISSVFMCRVYRDPADAADTFGSSVWLKSADIHIEADTCGSRSELSK